MFKVLVALLLSVGISGAASATNLNSYLTVGYSDLVDDTGYNYGVDFYVDSTYGGQICVYTRITSRSNVNGTVQPGPMLLQPNERGVIVGSFVTANDQYGWEVNIESTGDDSCY